MKTQTQMHFTASLESISTEEQLGLEGLLDTLKGLFGRSKEDKLKKDREADTEIIDFAQAQQIGKILVDARVAKNLTVKTGDIPARQISGALLGRHTDPDNIRKTLSAMAQLFHRSVKSASAEVPKIERWMIATGKKLEAALEDDRYDILVREFKSQHLYPVRGTPSDIQGLYGGQLSVDKGRIQPDWDVEIEPVATLPRLTKDQIIQAANGLLVVALLLKDQEKYSVDASKLYGPYEGERAVMELVFNEAYDSDEIEMLEVFHRKTNESQGWDGALSRMRWNLEDAVEAVETWIYHSIDWEATLA